LKREEYWKLTINFWPSALAAGVRPVAAAGFPRDENPAYFRPHDIDFLCAPSRMDFLAVVRITPWMRTWEKDLIPLLAENDWPMIDYMHKAASVDLRNEQDQIVGRIDVRRHEQFSNQPYRTMPVLCDVRDNIINRLPSPKRQEARTLIDAKENYIREFVTSSKRIDEHGLKIAIQTVLFDAGLRKSRPAA
jgi:hypothetical protein